MNEIKFSHDYEKLPINFNGRHARLLDIRNIKLEEQSPAFLEFDTRIRGGGHYDLPKSGDYLLLLFELVMGGGFFTTIRRRTDEKEKYYRARKGAVFTLVKIELDK